MFDPIMVLNESVSFKNIEDVDLNRKEWSISLSDELSCVSRLAMFMISTS